jgi:predicted nucleic acid-binding protein
MRRYHKDALTRAGRLKRKYRPAVYFEASVVVDYWSAEGLESHLDAPKEIPLGQEYDEAVRSLFRYHDKLRKMALVRREVCLGLSKLNVVTSPLAVLELFEWHAHSSFKQIASHAAGIVTVDRMSRKEVGEFLARIWKEGEEEEERVPDSHIINKAPKAAILRDCLMNTSFMEFHGLDGIIDVDIRHLTIDAGKLGSSLAILAYHQIGLADLMHLAAAKHLGCRYFASFDSDFRRCRAVIEKEFGLELISDVDSLLLLVKKNS